MPPTEFVIIVLSENRFHVMDSRGILKYYQRPQNQWHEN